MTCRPSLAAIESIRPTVQPAGGQWPTRRSPRWPSSGRTSRNGRASPGRCSGPWPSMGVNILAISTSISTVTCIIELNKLKDALAASDEHFEHAVN